MSIANDLKKYWINQLKPGNATAEPKVSSSSVADVSTTSNSCYDSYFCLLPSLAYLNYILMGVVAILVCIAGILANTILIPTFNMIGIRSSATVYMTSIAVCDAIGLMLAVILIVVKNLQPSFDGQLTMYQNFIGYLLPFGLPVKELVELLSLWLVVALLCDRFLNRKRVVNISHNVRSCCVKVLLALIISFALYTIPKFLKYKLVETSNKNETAKVKVMLTLLAQGDLYQNIMFWLKLPIEVALPYVLIFILVIIVGYSMRHKKSAFQYSSSCRAISHDQMIVRENRNTLMAVLIGLLVLLFKLPRFIAFFNGGNRVTRLHIISDFCDLCSMALKPVIYLSCGSHLRQVLRDMLYLYICPSRTNEIVLAGGLGSTVTLHSTKSKTNMSSCATQVTFSNQSVPSFTKNRLHSSIFLGRGDTLSNIPRCDSEPRAMQSNCTSGENHHQRGSFVRPVFTIASNEDEKSYEIPLLERQ